jgi:hypothetical protein
LSDFGGVKPTSLGGSGIAALWTTDGGDWKYVDGVLTTTTPGKITFEQYPDINGSGGLLYANVNCTGSGYLNGKLLQGALGFYGTWQVCFGEDYANLGVEQLLGTWPYGMYYTRYSSVDTKGGKLEFVAGEDGFTINSLEYLKPTIPFQSIGQVPTAYEQNYKCITCPADPCLFCDNLQEPPALFSVEVEGVSESLEMSCAKPIQGGANGWQVDCEGGLPVWSGGAGASWVEPCIPDCAVQWQDTPMRLVGNAYWTVNGTRYDYNGDFTFNDDDWTFGIYGGCSRIGSDADTIYYAVLGHVGGSIEALEYYRIHLDCTGCDDYGILMTGTVTITGDSEIPPDYGCDTALLGTIVYSNMTYGLWSPGYYAFYNGHYTTINGTRSSAHDFYGTQTEAEAFNATYVVSKASQCPHKYNGSAFPAQHICYATSGWYPQVMLNRVTSQYYPTVYNLDFGFNSFTDINPYTQTDGPTWRRALSTTAGFFAYGDRTKLPELSYDPSSRQLTIEPFCVVDGEDSRSFDEAQTYMVNLDGGIYDYPADLLDTYYITIKNNTICQICEISGQYYNQDGLPICTIYAPTGCCNSPHYRLYDTMVYYCDNGPELIQAPREDAYWGNGIADTSDMNHYHLASGIFITSDGIVRIQTDDFVVNDHQYINGDYELYYDVDDGHLCVADYIPDFPVVSGNLGGSYTVRKPWDLGKKRFCRYGEGIPLGVLSVWDSSYSVAPVNTLNYCGQPLAPAPPYSGVEIPGFGSIYGQAYSAFCTPLENNQLIFTDDHTFCISGYFEYFKSNNVNGLPVYCGGDNQTYRHCSIPSSGSYSYYYLTAQFYYTESPATYYETGTLQCINQSYQGHSWQTYDLPVAEVHHIPGNYQINDIRPTPVAKKHGIDWRLSRNIVQLYYDNGIYYHYSPPFAPAIFNYSITNSGSFISTKLHLLDHIQRMVYWVDDNRYVMENPRGYDLQMPPVSGVNYKIYFDTDGVLKYDTDWPAGNVLRMASFTWNNFRQIVLQGYNWGGSYQSTSPHSKTKILDCRKLSGLTLGINTLVGTYWNGSWMAPYNQPYNFGTSKCTINAIS